MKRLGHLCLPISLVALVVSLLLPGIAFAHEQRLVAGKYSFDVGFLDEPPLVGQVNAIDLTVTIPSEKDRPVKGLENTLTAMVIVGGNARTSVIPLEPREGEPGAYNGYFIPTIEGTYQFQFTGKVENTNVAEVFESGPGRFSDVLSPQAFQFPDKLPDPGATANEIRNARDASASARLFGLAALGVGIVGLVVGGVALVTRRRSSETSRDEEP